VAFAAVAALAATVIGQPSFAGGAEGDQWRADETYTGTFPDPTIMVVGNTYVASATTTANLNLPILTSTDLVRWTPRPPLHNWSQYSTWRLYNDAMVQKPTWAATRGQRDKVALMSQWAPSLAKVGDHYVAAYSAAVKLEPRESCIGIASSNDPLGQYRDTRTEPLVCYPPSEKGAIDPDVFVHPNGRAYLLWKNEGHWGTPPRLMARKLNRQGVGFAPRSRPVVLAQRDRAWEGTVVENPSMVHHRRKFFLFYSGNAWRTASYATGYAVCDTPLGPCRKKRSPVLATGSGVYGPGGADAFVDLQGRLRLLYHAYSAGRIGEGHPRRLHVATLDNPTRSRLTVTHRG
jgi:hypothetical protein